jgi:hypothetical protein
LDEIVLHSFGNPFVHLLDGTRRTIIVQATAHLLEGGRWKQPGAAQHDDVALVLDLELGARLPALALAHCLRDDHLALAGQPRLGHGHLRLGKTPVR